MARLQQEVEHGLGQFQQVQRLRDPGPADSVARSDLGAVADLAVIEQPLELEGKAKPASRRRPRSLEK